MIGGVASSDSSPRHYARWSRQREAVQQTDILQTPVRSGIGGFNGTSPTAVTTDAGGTEFRTNAVVLRAVTLPTGRVLVVDKATRNRSVHLADDGGKDRYVALNMMG
jgi:hypothetical protein